MLFAHLFRRPLPSPYPFSCSTNRFHGENRLWRGPKVRVLLFFFLPGPREKSINMLNQAGSAMRCSRWLLGDDSSGLSIIWGRIIVELSTGWSERRSRFDVVCVLGFNCGKGDLSLSNLLYWWFWGFLSGVVGRVVMKQFRFLGGFECDEENIASHLSLRPQDNDCVDWR